MVGIKLRIKAEEPCSSAAARAADKEEEELRNGAGSLLNSPVSPVGRVAKRNASLLNGFDLKNGAAYSESMVGTVPDIQIHSVHECIPALKAVLETRLEEEDKKTLLDDLQFQLELYLASNVDLQKNVSGEVTFLETGDYPREDFSNRLMPVYESRWTEPLKKETPRVRKRASVVEMQEPCSSTAVNDEEDAGSDVISSMDDEIDTDYNVLDVPHRFWSWAREYIGHVDKKYLESFDKEFYQRYQAENMADYFVNEPFKYKRTSPTKNGKSTQNGKSDSSNCVSKKSSNGLSHKANGSNGLTSKYDKPQVFDLMKKLVYAYAAEHKPAPANGTSNGVSPKSKRSTSDKRGRKESLDQSVHPAPAMINGLEAEEEEPVQISDRLMQEMAFLLADCVAPVSGASDFEDEESRDSFLDSTRGGALLMPDPDLTMRAEDGGSPSFRESQLIKVDLEGAAAEDEDWDEVSLELLEAQKKLERLLRKTNPILKRCKKKLEAEHAHWATNRALNEADDELFLRVDSLGRSSTNAPSAKSDAVQAVLEAMEKREMAFVQHHLRDVADYLKGPSPGAAEPTEQGDAPDSDFSNELDLEAPPRLSLAQ